MQAYSEIAKDFVDLFLQLEWIFTKRFNQMSVDEMTTCASGFAVSGFGTPFFFQMMEMGILKKLHLFQLQSLKEICRGFLFSMRGSKVLLKMLLPRILPILTEFSVNE
jgi:hypothetical protein